VSDASRRAQELLGRTVARAQAEEDRELARTVREQGMALATVLNGLFHMGRIHALNNAAFDAPVGELANRLRGLLDLLGPVHLLCVEGQIYVNDVRVRFDLLVEQSLTLESELSRHDVGGITFNLPLGGADVRELIRLIIQPAAPGRPRAALQDQLDAVGMTSIELHPVLQFRITGEDAAAVSEEFRDIYLASAGIVAEAFATLGADRLPNPLPARRAVVQLLDATHGDDAAAAARDADETLPGLSRHTMMVTNLSLLIGRQAGLPNASLADLGVAAIFHDVGFSSPRRGTRFPSSGILAPG